MKKAVLAVLVVFGLVSVGFVPAVNASEPQTIAIIDSAIDSSKLSNVVHEVCFTLATCPNGQTLSDSQGSYSYSEGKGTAAIQDFKIKGADHGFNMAKIATVINPNVRIVFIRISDEKVYDTFSMIRNDGGSLARALAWVSNNSSKFNIKAVSISQSRSNFAVGTCPTDTLFESSVATLKTKNIATFVATGNDSKKNHIGFPACVKGVYSVAPATEYTTFVATGNDSKKNHIGFPACVKGVYSVAGATADGVVVKNSNINDTTSIVSRVCANFVGTACLKVQDYRGNMTAMSGTSVATVVAASLAVTKIKNESWDVFLSSLPKAGKYPSLLN